MEFLTGMNIVLVLMNIGMLTYIHTSHVFNQNTKNLRTTEGDADNDEDTYFS